MIRTMALATAVIALFGAANVAMAETGAQSGHKGEGTFVTDQVSKDRCDLLMKQFDGAKNPNAKAMELRKNAQDDCENSDGAASDGVKELEQALKMIGLTPKEK